MTQPQIPDELWQSLMAPPTKPNKAQLLGAALGALLFPRGAGAFLSAPQTWAQQQTMARMQQAQNALNALLKIAGLGIEQRKAEVPLEVAQVRESGATERQQREIEEISKPKLQLEQQRVQEIEKPKAEAEIARTQALAEEVQQRTQLSPKERYLRLAEQYAAYLGSPNYTPQGEAALRKALEAAAEQVGVEVPQAQPQPSVAQKKAEAEAQLTQERATTERELREPKKQQMIAKTNLIKADTLLKAATTEEVKANIQALRQRIAQGWANVSLRARTLALAQQRADDHLLVELLKNSSNTINNIDRQILELRTLKSKLAYPMSAGGVSVPAYDQAELDAMINELTKQKQANQEIVDLGNSARKRLQQRLGITTKPKPQAQKQPAPTQKPQTPTPKAGGK